MGIPVRTEAKPSEAVQESAYIMSPDAVGLGFLTHVSFWIFWEGGDDGERNT